MAETTTVVDVVFCPTCESAALPSSTVCGECGERLTPPVPQLPARHGRDCPCVPCTMALYDDGLPL